MTSATTMVIEGMVDDLSHDGRGVIKVADKIYFVPGALPGETIRFIPRKKRKGILTGELQQIVEPSTDRVNPPCEYFGVCGGCSLQHLRIDAQLQHKEKVLFDNLQRIGSVKPEQRLQPLQKESWHYRRKARPGCKFVAKKGGILVGFREQGNSFLTSLKSCKTLDTKLSDLLSPLHDLVQQLSCYQQIPQIEMALADNAVALVMRHLVPLNDDDLATIAGFAQANNVHFYVQPGGLDTVAPVWPKKPDALYYFLPDYDLQMVFSATDFIQVNGLVNQSMINQALTHLQPVSNDHVLDLFCGLGNFTLPVARSGAMVTGIEGDQVLVEKGRFNARHNRIDNVDFKAMNLHSEDVRLLADTQYNKLLLDPPRSGALDVVTHLVPRLMPEKLVYVSCNPATLARDADILVNQHGYRFTHAGAIDMFPHTAHIESMGVFSLG